LPAAVTCSGARVPTTCTTRIAERPEEVRSTYTISSSWRTERFTVSPVCACSSRITGSAISRTLMRDFTRLPSSSRRMPSR
jgi:hypothetical protein